MSLLRVCHVTASLDPQQGGLASAVMELGLAQRELHLDATVIGMVPDGRAIEVARASRLYRTSGLPIYAIAQSGPLGRAAAYVSLIRCLEDQKPHIVHLHGFWEPLIAALALLCHQRNIPYVIAPHGMLYDYCFNIKGTKKAVAWQLVYKVIAQQAQFVQALNDDERRQIAARLPDTKIIVAGNGYRHDQQAASQQHDRVMTSLQLKKPFFLYVGRLHPIKGLDLLLQAMRTYVDRGGTWHLMIVGPDCGIGGELERQASDLKILNQVSFTGPLYGAERLAMYREADAYVQASRHETFSMSITEALSFGLPVIATHSSHFPEIESSSAGILVDQDAEQLAAAMLCLSTNEASRSAMAAAASRLAKVHCDWSTSATNLKLAYTEAIRH